MKKSQKWFNQTKSNIFNPTASTFAEAKKQLFEHYRDKTNIILPNPEKITEYNEIHAEMLYKITRFIRPSDIHFILKEAGIESTLI